MVSNGSAADQAGEFWGSFVFTIISKGASKIFKRKHINNDQIAESVRDLADIIELIYLFKMMHDFAQKFLDYQLKLLFGGDKIKYKSTDKVKEAWQEEYEGKYEGKILVFKDRVESLEQKMQEGGEEYVAKGSKRTDSKITEPMRVVKKCAPIAAEMANEFISEIEERARDALDEKLPADKLSKFRKSAELKAKRVLTNADEVLVALIEILDRLYEQITR